jgi:ATP synthase subunit 6
MNNTLNNIKKKLGLNEFFYPTEYENIVVTRDHSFDPSTYVSYIDTSYNKDAVDSIHMFKDLLDVFIASNTKLWNWADLVPASIDTAAFPSLTFWVVLFAYATIVYASMDYNKYCLGQIIQRKNPLNIFNDGSYNIFVKEQKFSQIRCYINKDWDVVYEGLISGAGYGNKRVPICKFHILNDLNNGIPRDLSEKMKFSNIIHLDPSGNVVENINELPYVMINSPIEQFLVLPSEFLNGFSNMSLFYSFITLLFISLIFFYIFNKIQMSINKLYFLFEKIENIYRGTNYLNIFSIYSFIPTRLQLVFEILVLEFIKSFKSLINLKNIFIFFYSIIATIFFILFSNMIGLIPYTFTITAQIFITLNLALLLFIGFNLIGFIKYGYYLLSIVVPSGVHILLHFLLIPIELISYVFKPISLGIRLFANIMAGHTLLKVICNFIYKSFSNETYLILNMLPFVIISILFILESFVAMIQSYVFFILLCLFLKDILILNH